MFSDQSVLDRISNDYYLLTDAERKVADYVVIHQKDTQFMSISELAESCGVAEATVSRFCRRLNYSGYSAFKLAVAHAHAPRPEEVLPTGAVTAEDSIPDLCQKIYSVDMDALNQALSLIRPETLQAAADLLLAARNVYCMGQGGSMIIAMEAAHLFSTSLPGFHAVWDSHLQAIAAANMTAEDVVIFFSYSGSTKELMELLPVIKERRAKVILVTHFPKSPAAAFADVILQCGANENPLQHGSIPTRIALLFLLHALFSEVCRRSPELRDETQERVAAALSNKHI